MTTVSALVSLAFAIAACVGAPPESTSEGYALSRSVALIVLVGLAWLLRSNRGIALAAVAMVVVQVMDGLVGLHSGEPLKVVGPWLTAAANAAFLTAFVRRGGSIRSQRISRV